LYFQLFLSKIKVKLPSPQPNQYQNDSPEIHIPFPSTIANILSSIAQVTLELREVHP